MLLSRILAHIRFTMVSCMLCVAGNLSLPTEAAASDDLVISFINGRCEQEHSDFSTKAIADKDIFERLSTQTQKEDVVSNADLLPVAVWYMMSYAVIDNGIFGYDAQKMSEDKRNLIADSLETSVALMRCLTPADGDWIAYKAATKFTDDSMAEVQSSACLLPWAEKMTHLLRGDLKGDVLGAALDKARIEMNIMCKKKS